jgi:hypothetical protein
MHGLDITTILSSIELGVLLSTLLFGVILVQTYHVLTAELSPGQRWLKPLVVVVW